MKTKEKIKKELTIGDIPNLGNGYKWWLIGYSMGFREGAKWSEERGLFHLIEKEIKLKRKEKL